MSVPSSSSHSELFCVGGHPLELTPVKTLSERKNSPYSSGAKCDVCGNAIGLLEKLYHCEQCMFDMCLTCNRSRVILQCPKCQDERREWKLNPASDRYCCICKKGTAQSKHEICCCHCDFVLCLTCYRAILDLDKEKTIPARQRQVEEERKRRCVEREKRRRKRKEEPRLMGEEGPADDFDDGLVGMWA